MHHRAWSGKASCDPPARCSADISSWMTSSCVIIKTPSQPSKEPCDGLRWSYLCSLLVAAAPYIRYVPSETIVLDDVSCVAIAPDRGVVHGCDGSCCFSVTTPKRTFYLIAEGRSERDGWMAAIELNVFLRHWRKERSLLSQDYIKQPPRPDRRAAVSEASAVGSRSTLDHSSLNGCRTCAGCNQCRASRCKLKIRSC